MEDHQKEEANKIQHYCQEKLGTVILEVTDLYFNQRPKLVASISIPRQQHNKYIVTFTFGIYGYPISILYEILHAPSMESEPPRELMQGIMNLIYMKLKKSDEQRESEVIVHLTYRNEKG